MIKQNQLITNFTLLTNYTQFFKIINFGSWEQYLVNSIIEGWARLILE